MSVFLLSFKLMKLNNIVKTYAFLMFEQKHNPMGCEYFNEFRYQE